jgi:type II secretory pathway pseudopilin PulG
LLVVISVIVVLAALTFPAVQAAKVSMLRARAKSELRGLQTAIENYKDKLGYYPPDNRIATNATSPEAYVLNQLYYELLGTTNASGTFHTLDDSAQIRAADLPLPAVFGPNVTGFMNCAHPRSGDELPSGVPFLKGLKPSQYMALTNPGTTAVVYVLGASLEGPPAFGPGLAAKFSPWRYNSSNPRYNTKTFDLWIDVIAGSKTNRICNWSDKPLVVSAPYGPQ